MYIHNWSTRSFIYQDYFLTSRTNYFVYALFSLMDRQIFEKLYNDNFIYTHRFCQKRKPPKMYFFIFDFDGDV